MERLTQFYPTLKTIYPSNGLCVRSREAGANASARSPSTTVSIPGMKRAKSRFHRNRAVNYLRLH
jgi:hypothetical protein